MFTFSIVSTYCCVGSVSLRIMEMQIQIANGLMVCHILSHTLVILDFLVSSQFIVSYMLVGYSLVGTLLMNIWSISSVGCQVVVSQVCVQLLAFSYGKV